MIASSNAYNLPLRFLDIRDLIEKGQNSMSDFRSVIEEALAAGRKRSSWNERLTHWERPASDSEEAKIQRAANVASQVVNGNAYLMSLGVTIRPQGSYFNNTNVRLESDMDLRVQIPEILVKCADNVDFSRAYQFGRYIDTGRPVVDVANDIRNALAADCRARFGEAQVTLGKKAVTVDGFSGSRADVDLVPALRFHWITNDGRGGFNTTEGVVIVGKDGSQTINFPEQHHTNGKAKRERTQHRFKKVVRMLKRLNYELEELGLISNRAPSFLVECLVYSVEDSHFLVEEDRYDRLRRICRRIQAMLYDSQVATGLCEINDIKFLFHVSQAWTLDQAKVFIDAAIARLEA